MNRARVGGLGQANERMAQRGSTRLKLKVATPHTKWLVRPMLTKYWYVCRKYLYNAYSIAIAADASRGGKSEVLMTAVMRTDIGHKFSFKACWGLPIVLKL